MSDRLTCSFCVFYEGERQQPAVGACRRYPPVFVGLTQQANIAKASPQLFPAFAAVAVRGKVDWCSEHQEIPELLPEGAKAS